MFKQYLKIFGALLQLKSQGGRFLDFLHFGYLIRY